MTRKRLLVPEARQGMDLLKARVMRENGYTTQSPEQVKYEVAQEKNIALKKGYNGQLTSAEAGQVGGPIGGHMVKELVRMAQENIVKDNQ
ncbi:alpha/beta-type small acid-soluble spore protein [Caldalkalibacillus salinus]|uniref:alpha/beta-type small acid-soluble spore protein n=1 Tax=Caldalkalibacillus salinus TaxID=2803787 RepID=UPI0019210EB0|nr:alpha/beta-type small acid-soluble spore protein [Caldalkalibacillus salinus]